MNYTGVGLDLQGIVKKVYYDLLYRSTFMNFLDKSYLGEVRTTGTPMIEIAVTKPVSVTTVTNKAELTSPMTPTLADYDSVKIDLTELRANYSVSVSPRVQNLAQAIDSQIDQEDAAIAYAIDGYGYGKLRTATNAAAWAPETKDEYIALLNGLKAKLFNKKVYDGYKLGLEAEEYAKLVSALVSILHFETSVGRNEVDRGVFANAFGIDIFPIASSVLNGEIGYFASEKGIVGDLFFSQFNLFNGNYNGLPGYTVIEGIVFFGAGIVLQDTVIKLQETVSA